MDKEVVSLVIGAVLIVLITVALATGLCIRVVRMLPPTPAGPVMIGMNSTAHNNDGNYVNITWRVVAVSRADIKWSDIKIKCFASGVRLTKTTTASPPTGEFYISNMPMKTWYAHCRCAKGKIIENYVEGAETITIEFNADDLGGSAGGEVAEIDLVYIPTHSTVGMHTVLAPSFAPAMVVSRG